MRVAASFTVEGIEPAGDPVWQAAPESLRREFWKAALAIVLRAKDAELAKGLDRYGRALTPIAASTRKHRHSEMGPADPQAPPLTPARGASRTRLNLTGRAYKDHLLVYWTDGWGKVLKVHAHGSRRRHLPKRDVIGISPESLRKVRRQALAWWETRKRREVVLRPVPTLPPGVRLPVLGRSDFHNFTYGIGSNGGNQAAVSAGLFAAGKSTGFFQKAGPGGFRPEPLPNPYMAPRPTPKPTPKPRPKPKPPAPKPAPAATPAPAAPAFAGPILPGRPVAERIAAWEEGGRKAAEFAAAGRATAGLRRGREAAQAAVDALSEEVRVDPRRRLGQGWQARADAALAELDRAEKALHRARTEAADRARRLLGVPAAERPRFAVRSTGDLDAVSAADPTLRARAEAVLARLNTMVRGSGTVDLDFKAIRPGEEQRDFHRGTNVGGRFSTVHLTAATPDQVIAHELAHALEHQVPGVHERVMEFLRYRCGDEAPVRLGALFPGANYGESEYGRKDDFGRAFTEREAYYVGKVYGHEASEVMSMGVEKLWTDPAGFAEKDPEFFKLVLGLLSGALR